MYLQPEPCFERHICKFHCLYKGPLFFQVVNFTCQVRSKHTQTILLSNRTNQTWNLHPIFEGEHWEGSEFITLEPHQQNKPYEITYRPRTMNLENRKHQVGSTPPVSWHNWRRSCVRAVKRQSLAVQRMLEQKLTPSSRIFTPTPIEMQPWLPS